jgi:hypothetical protein
MGAADRTAMRRVITVVETEAPSREELAQRRARYLSGLVWHAGAFVIINAFFWGLDLLVGEPGIQWAIWITVFWGFALAFHALAYLVDGRQLERRRAQRYLDEEQRATRPRA